MNSKTSEEPPSLMGVVLPGGVWLGDATRQQVMEAVEHYRKQQEKCAPMLPGSVSTLPGEAAIRSFDRCHGVDFELVKPPARS
jgi:hypothetical protein